MRSVFFISVIMFMAVVASGYSVVWYFQSKALKNQVMESINQINAQQKYLTYDSIETSGFPSNLYVSIVKPHFKGRADLLLKSLRDPSGKNQFDSLPAWDEDDVLDGRISFGISVFSDIINFNLSGNWQEVSKIGDKIISTSHQQIGNSNCAIKIHRDLAMVSMLWDFKSLENDPQSFFKYFQTLDCTSPGNTTIDAATKERLASSGPLHFLYR